VVSLERAIQNFWLIAPASYSTFDKLFNQTTQERAVDSLCLERTKQIIKPTQKNHG